MKVSALICLAVAGSACDHAYETRDSGTRDSSMGSDAATGDFDAIESADGEIADIEQDAGAIGFCPHSPCEGLISGTWQYAGVCGDGAFGDFRRNCPGFVSSLRINSTSGRLDLKLDGSYRREFTRTIEGTFRLDSGCLDPFGGCVAYGASLRPGGICADSAGTCTCTVSARPSQTSTGTYSTLGASIVLQPSAGPAETYEYCVNSMSSALWLHLVEPAISPESYNLIPLR